MKVLLVGSDASVSGAGLSMVALSEELNRLGVQTVLVVRHGNTQRILEKNGKDYYAVDSQSWMYSATAPAWKKYLAGFAKRALNIRPYFQMLRIIEKENPDIVHINAGTTYVAAKAAIRCKKRIVWHIRELMEEDLGSSFAHPEYSKKLMGQAECLIAISKAVADKFQAVFPQKKVYTVYNGIDLTKYVNKEHRIFRGSKVIFTIAGRINENKGQAEVVRGLSRVLKNNNAELWIAGTGTDTEMARLQSIITEYDIPAEKIKFLGYVENMPEIWSQTDIAIMASKCEAFGRTTVEAMASGCLVIGADTGGTVELISDGKTGLLYKQGNEESLEDRVNYALANKEEMIVVADDGRKEACDRFSAMRNAEEISIVYRRLVSERKNDKNY